MRPGNSYILKFAILFTFVMLLIAVIQLSSYHASSPKQLVGVLRPEFRALRLDGLTDHNDNPFDEARLKNKWTFVFFGYTSCPDICPATLYILDTVQQSLDQQGSGVNSDIQVVFISVDPVRDSPEKLAEYVFYFNSEFTGVTGDKKAIDAVAKQFGAGYMYEPETAAGEYLVNHTSAVFLVDPQARLVATFSQPHIADTITAQFKKIQQHITR